MLSVTACEFGSSLFGEQIVDEPAEQEATPDAELNTEVSARFIERAAAALPEAWPKGAEVVELRISAAQIELQGGFLPKKDVEGTVPQQAFIMTFSCDVDDLCIFSPPKMAQLTGKGRFIDNLFPLSKLHLAGIARSLITAKKSVDPDQGRVTEIRARRFLPFSKAVRVRYYVQSPLMAGTMDANGRGIPLKR